MTYMIRPVFYLCIAVTCTFALTELAPLLAADARQAEPYNRSLFDPWERPVHIPKSLDEIRIDLGEYIFNEPNGGDYKPQYNGSWRTDDLWLTTDGKVGGTFTTIYAGPPVTHAQFKDVLFVRVVGWYIWPQYRDFWRKPLEDPIPVVALESTLKMATFDLMGSFPIPRLLRNIDGGMPLDHLALDLTWVRVYKNKRGYVFHIFPGDTANHSDIENPPTIMFNQQPRAVSGRFLYYDAIAEKLLSGVRYDWAFDYRAWLKENMRW